MSSEDYSSRVLLRISPLEHLVRPKNTVTYSVGNRGQIFFEVFAENALLKRSSAPSVEQPAIFRRSRACALYLSKT